MRPVRTRPKLLTDRRGSVALLAGVGMVALVGMSAFAIDLGTAYAQRARLQKVADSAAMAGAISWVKKGSAAAVTATVKDVVIANGWPASVIQATSAPTTANPKITVSLATTSALTLGRVLSSATSVRTTGYAIATVRGGSAPACLVSLSTLMINGSVNVNGCAAGANSTASNAITVNSGGSLTATSINTPGSVVNNGTITGTINTGAAAATDPFAGYQSQANSGLNGSCQSDSNQNPLPPGCWTNVNVNSPRSLSPGTFFFPNGMNINSGGSISGLGGVTMVMGSQFSPSAPIAITAPTTGAWAGMAIYLTNGMNANSGVSYAVNGAIYSPSAALTLGTGTWNQSDCTNIVANGIIFNSGSSFTLPQSNCGSYAYPTPGVGSGAQIALIQ